MQVVYPGRASARPYPGPVFVRLPFARPGAFFCRCVCHSRNGQDLDLRTSGTKQCVTRMNGCYSIRGGRRHAHSPVPLYSLPLLRRPGTFADACMISFSTTDKLRAADRGHEKLRHSSSENGMRLFRRKSKPHRLTATT